MLQSFQLRIAGNQRISSFVGRLGRECISKGDRIFSLYSCCFTNSVARCFNELHRNHPASDILPEMFRILLPLNTNKTVKDFAEIWFQQRPQVTFHDPLAGAVIFDDSICRFMRCVVEVELASSALRGMTIGVPDPESGPHEAAATVDRERFFEHFFGVFG